MFPARRLLNAQTVDEIFRQKGQRISTTNLLIGYILLNNNTCARVPCAQGDMCTSDMCTSDMCTSDMCTSDMCTSDMCTSDMCTSDMCKFLISLTALVSRTCLNTYTHANLCDKHLHKLVFVFSVIIFV
eukprot:GHVS01014471.1.p1 GENE.GHVS01014471.1~~GHVS01014471.1.p1  ORF type:complete len:129 (-),score=9.72 GHVS01014471.1:232-618(-)